MKLLFARTCRGNLVTRLATEFPESAHVVEIGLDQATDEENWAHAVAEDFVVVSKDSDFRQLAFLYGPPPKVVWLRMGNVSTDAIHDLLAASVAVLEAFDHADKEALLSCSTTVGRTMWSRVIGFVSSVVIRSGWRWWSGGC